MRLFFQIFIIAFVVVSLYIIRDDIKSVYNHVVSSVKGIQMGNDETLSKEGSTSNIIKAKTPGPLRVAENFLALNTTTRLSIKNVITLTNQNRKENGNLIALKENMKLDVSAEKKLKDMFAKQYFEHVSPNGTGVADLAHDASYEYIIIGENLALGNFKDDKALVDAWMASPGHRANILNAHYTEIGVAVGRGTFEGKDTWLAVQHFGLPRTACPSVDKGLQVTITATDQQVKVMSDELSIRHQKIESGAVYEGMTTNEQIEKYNTLVPVYNQLITDLKTKIDVYNSQIRALNYCIASNT